MKHIALLLSVLAFAACKKTPERDAYAVGGWLGTGSVFGPGPKCTYEVTPASAAELGENKTSGKLLAPGTGTTKCESGYTDAFDIVVADHATITGDVKLGVGKEGMLQAHPYAGARELKTSGHFAVEWKAAPECAAILTSETDTPAGGDSLRGSYSLDMKGVAKGSCTITASVLGQTSTQTVTVQ